jgi:hypothetical protein
LDERHPFDTGPNLDGLLDGLLVLAAESVNVMRGYHDCQLCGVESPIVMEIPKTGTRVSLGDDELRAMGADGRRYAAPTLIAHYVRDHEYRPPTDFQTAVVETAFGLDDRSDVPLFDDLSDAVLVYLAQRDFTLAQRDIALRESFGAARGARLISQVRELLCEVTESRQWWNTDNPTRSGEDLRRELLEDHPYLHGAAADALVKEVDSDLW